jgi:tetratricopeptide (TPR) repeat protein
LESTRRRHAAHYLAAAEEAYPALLGPEVGTWLARLEADHDNMRAALAWAIEQKQADTALRLAAALHRFWHIHGRVREGRRWLEAALALLQCVTAAVRAEALLAAGDLASNDGDYGQARALLEESVALRRRAGDIGPLPAALFTLGWAVLGQGEYDRAAALFAESLELAEMTGDRLGQAVALNGLGSLARRRGELDRARAHYEASLARCRAVGFTWGLSILANNAGVLALAQGDYRRARGLFEEALARRHALGLASGHVDPLAGLGRVALSLGEPAEAGRWHRKALALSWELGNQGGIARGLEELAEVLLAQGQPARAARLWGAMEALREAVGMPLPPDERRRHEELVATARADMDEASWAEAWAEGRAPPLEQVVAEALVAPCDPAPADAVSPERSGPPGPGTSS